MSSRAVVHQQSMILCNWVWLLCYPPAPQLLISMMVGLCIWNRYHSIIRCEKVTSTSYHLRVRWTCRVLYCRTLKKHESLISFQMEWYVLLYRGIQLVSSWIRWMRIRVYIVTHTRIGLVPVYFVFIYQTTGIESYRPWIIMLCLFRLIIPMSHYFREAFLSLFSLLSLYLASLSIPAHQCCVIPLLTNNAGLPSNLPFSSGPVIGGKPGSRRQAQ